VLAILSLVLKIQCNTFAFGKEKSTPFWLRVLFLSVALGNKYLVTVVSSFVDSCDKCRNLSEQ